MRVEDISPGRTRSQTPDASEIKQTMPSAPEDSTQCLQAPALPKEADVAHVQNACNWVQIWKRQSTAHISTCVCWQSLQLRHNTAVRCDGKQLPAKAARRHVPGVDGTVSSACKAGSRLRLHKASRRAAMVLHFVTSMLKPQQNGVMLQRDSLT